jgi:cobyrinic acid a,c-diamide synthase
MKTALLAGTHSGCGKTTLTLALLQYFRQAKHSIISYKAGPDFLDPMWHQAVTGKPSYNLDTRMMGADACRKQLHQHAKQADFALIEGVMGLFDGYAGVGGEGSSVDLARVLGCPVILVVDAGGMSGTIAAVVTGFCQLAEQKNVRLSGIIANKVGGEYHAELLRQALAEYKLPPLLAWMECSDKVLTERHLGLKMPDETMIPDYSNALHVDHQALRHAFSEVTGNTPAIPNKPQLQGKTIAVARDNACCFIYPANLDWLRSHGAKLAFFSPVAGEPVPDGADAIWLSGGYPELYAQQLSKSDSWDSLCQHADAGTPILAECGGAMLLGKSLLDVNGDDWPMAGIFPYVSVMQTRLVALGHREEASGVKGHEFHYSKREQDEGLLSAFDVAQGDKGVRYKNVRSSYVHWYFSTALNQACAWSNVGN